MGDAEAVDIGQDQAVESTTTTEPSGGGYEETSHEEPISETTITPEPREEPPLEGEVQEGITEKQITNALKALRESDPRAADELRKAYFSNQQWAGTFGNPREAKIAKLAWDSVGGETGFAALREQVQASEYLEQAAENGDPSIIDDWAKDYPGGFKEVMPYAVRKWASVDGESFQKAIAPHFSGFLDRSQLADRLSETFDAISNNNPQGAQSLLRNIYAWVAAQKQIGGQNGQPALNPAEEKLTQRENDLREREQRHFRGEIGRETFRYQQDSVQKALQPYLRNSKLSSPARARLVATINADINQTLERDQGYRRQVGAFLARQDAEGTKTYIKGHLDTIIQSIVRAAWQDLYGAAPKARKVLPAPENGRAASPNGLIRLNQKPAMSDIERNGSDWMASYIGGKAIMAKGPFKGKLVSWR